MLKGIAILFMVGLHLFNRSNYMGYYQPWFFFKNQPLIYYISFIFDACVPIYCFCSGYALYLKNAVSLKDNLKSYMKLLLNFWIILLMTCLAGFLLHSENIPGSFGDFLGTLLLYDIHYVGAWWFMQTYLLLIITAPFIIKIVNKQNTLLTILEITGIYVVSYYFRMVHPTGNYFVNIAVLYGTSLFSFVIGMLFYKYKIITKIRMLLQKSKYQNLIGLLILLFTTICHAVVKTMAIAPITALMIIIGFATFNISNNVIRKILLFFGNHSTNIWLTHMQFYMIFCKDIVFSTNTVIGCFIILLTMCIITSFIIKTIMKIITMRPLLN